jgi:hypothetical protein
MYPTFDILKGLFDGNIHRSTQSLTFILITNTDVFKGSKMNGISSAVVHRRK